MRRAEAVFSGAVSPTEEKGKRGLVFCAIFLIYDTTHARVVNAVAPGFAEGPAPDAPSAILPRAIFRLTRLARKDRPGPIGLARRPPGELVDLPVRAEYLRPQR